MTDAPGPNQQPDLSWLFQEPEAAEQALRSDPNSPDPTSPDLTKNILHRVNAARPFLDAHAKRTVRIRRVGVLCLAFAAVSAVAIVQRLAPEATSLSTRPATLTAAVASIEDTGTEASRLRDGLRQWQQQITAPIAVAASQERITLQMQNPLVCINQLPEPRPEQEPKQEPEQSVDKATPAEPTYDVRLASFKSRTVQAPIRSDADRAYASSYLLSLTPNDESPSRIRCVVFSDGLSIPVAMSASSQHQQHTPIRWPNIGELSPASVMPASLVGPDQPWATTPKPNLPRNDF